VSGPAEVWAARAEACAEALQGWYRPRTGLWATTGWWNSANALTALIACPSPIDDRVVSRTFEKAGRRHPGFTNYFFDDSAWWALAWIAAFDLTGSPRYLETAEGAFAHLVTGWDQVFGGGVWWSVERSYKNAIPNSLFLLTAARLHRRTGRAQYLDWAIREWQWFEASGMIGPSGLVNDGLNAHGVNNGGPTWTYNQGALVGGLAEMAQITRDASYTDVATGVADATLANLTADGVLTEPCTDCDGDQVQFKGIFMRNLLALVAVNPRPEYRSFILENASSLWECARNDDCQFGLRWQGPFDRADAGRQGSALDALNAAAAVSD
jgi:predicted alpha-1,6-mannanase (GH76 family)